MSEPGASQAIAKARHNFEHSLIGKHTLAVAELHVTIQVAANARHGPAMALACPCTLYDTCPLGCARELRFSRENLREA